MSQPKVTFLHRDFQIGSVATSSDVLAVAGVSSLGAVGQPVLVASVPQLTVQFGEGPAVELAAQALARGLKVLFGRVASSTPGAVVGALVGDDSFSLGDDPEPIADAELVLEVVKGGTVGQAGITYRLSYDDGRSWGVPTALGTATEVAFGGVVIEIASGALAAGARAAVATKAPSFSAEQLAPVVTALFDNATRWNLLAVAGAVDANLGGALDLIFNEQALGPKPRRWLAHWRNPNVGETPAAYLTASDAFANTFASKRGYITLGGALVTSAVTGRQIYAPSLYAAAAEEAALQPHVDSADTTRGPIPGVAIRDSNGNPSIRYLDETVYPGGDDRRFTTLRSWADESGAFINRPRLFSPSGSDYRLLPHGRVADLAQEICYRFMKRVLGKTFRISDKTGFILEIEAKRIESGLNAALTAGLMSEPMLSSVLGTVSRTDNLLPADSTMNVTLDMVPLYYAENILVSMGFVNPSVRAVAA